MTRKQYRQYKLNNFNKWFLIRFAGASNQHYEKVQLIQTNQYVGER